MRLSIEPVLASLGFERGPGRVFRRAGSFEGVVEIVELQLGSRFMEGRYTANRAVFDPMDGVDRVDRGTVREYHCHPKRRQRLGYLVERQWQRVLARVPLIGVLVGPRDVWWPAHDARSYARVVAALETVGMTWFANEALQRRDRR